MFKIIYNDNSLFHQYFKLIKTPYNEFSPRKKNVLKGLAFLATRGIQSIIFLSFVTFFYLLCESQWTARQYILGTWCVFEIVFYVFMGIRYTKLKIYSSFTPKSLLELEILAQDILSEIVKSDEHLGNWLINKPELLQVEHCREWLVWAFFNKDLENLSAEENLQADRIIEKFRLKLNNYSKPQTIKPKACLRPTLDALEVNFKPLIFYASMGVFRHLGNFLLLGIGFRRHKLINSNYWIYTPTEVDDQSDSQPPILFIHGVGVGLATYATLIYELRHRHPKRRILLLEVPCISLDPLAQITYFSETLLDINCLFQKNNIEKASIIGHSYGSIIVSWLINNRPSLISQITLVDAICFNMWESYTAMNSFYSPPISFLHEACQFYIFQDPLMNQVTAHSLLISDNILLTNKLKVKTRIFYSEFDYIVNAPSLVKHLQTYLQTQSNPQYDVTMYPITHGEFMFKPFFFKSIIGDL